VARALTPGVLTNLLEEPDGYLEKIFRILVTPQRTSPRQYRDLIDELTPPLDRIGHVRS
jgi:hypothetical protein